MGYTRECLQHVRMPQVVDRTIERLASGGDELGQVADQVALDSGALGLEKRVDVGDVHAASAGRGLLAHVEASAAA